MATHIKTNTWKMDKKTS